jgi:hypothetical protein
MANTNKPRRRKWPVVLLSIVVLLIIIRLILPYFVLNYLNKTLAGLKEYRGHIRDIDLAFIRGAYKINDIELLKKDTATGKTDSIPFFRSPEIDLSVEWKSLLKGSVVAEIIVEKPVLNFVKGKHKKESVKADTSDFQDVIKKMMPLKINHFNINDGEIHYIDKYSRPAIDIKMDNIQVAADNLSNVNDSNQVLPAALVAEADVYDGHFDMNVKFNPLEKKPTFDLNAKLTAVNMVKLNEFFRAYGNFDVKKGDFGLYTEFAAKDGSFNGYVKPLLRDVEVVQWNEKEGNIGQILWETVVGAVAEIIKNHPKDQVATKLPIKGRFDDPNAGLWTAINYVLRNAFVFALKPTIDNTINIGKVEEEPEKKTLLQKVFGKKHNGKENEKNGDSEKKQD